MELKNIKVKPPTFERLAKRGRYGETMDNIINGVLNQLENYETKK